MQKYLCAHQEINKENLAFIHNGVITFSKYAIM